MNFSHPETIELAKELVGSALYHYGADYVECSGCDAVIEEGSGTIVHNFSDCKVGDRSEVGRIGCSVHPFG